MRTLKRIVFAALAAGIVGGIVWSLLPKPVDVEVATIRRGSFEEIVEEDGRTRVRDRYEIDAPVSGRLLRIEREAGDTVEADAVVATIEPSAPPLLDVRSERQLREQLGGAEAGRERAAAEVERVEAALAQAKIDLARVQRLAVQGVVSPQDLDRATLAVTVSERELEAARYAEHMAIHEVEQARAALERARRGPATDGAAEPPMEVRAPVAGRVLRVLRESAGFVVSGTPLLEIADPEDLEVVVDLLTADAVRVRPGARARLARWGGPGALDARVRLVEPSAFTKLSALGVEEQRVNVVLDIVSPPERARALGDGFRVDVEIVVTDLADALTVPAGALFRAGEGWAVFAVEAGRAALRRVVLGPRSGARAVVVEGLAEGESVVLYPNDAVTDGARVRVRAIE